MFLIYTRKFVLVREKDVALLSGFTVLMALTRILEKQATLFGYIGAHLHGIVAVFK